LRDYDNKEHISRRQLRGVQKEPMAMTYKLVVSSLEALSRPYFKENVLGQKQVEGVWMWQNGDAL
jgi:hypothetical protein